MINYLVLAQQFPTNSFGNLLVIEDESLEEFMSTLISETERTFSTSFELGNGDENAEYRNIRYSSHADANEFSRQLSAGGNRPVESLRRDSFRIERGELFLDSSELEPLRILLAQASCQVFFSYVASLKFSALACVDSRNKVAIY